MIRGKSFLAPLLAVVAVSCCGRAYAADQTSVPDLQGLVESVSKPCDADGYHIRRASPLTEDNKLKRFLFSDDEIIIRKPGCEVIVTIGPNRRALIYEYSVTRPFVVPKTLPLPTISRIWVAAKAKFITPRERERGGSLRGSEEASIPLLRLWDSKIAAGTRALRLAWIGGERPFEVVLTRPNSGGDIVRQTHVEKSSTTLPDAILEPGKYRVSIRDSKGRTQSADLTVVDPQEMPVAPSDLQEYKNADPPRQLLYAAWLAAQKDGEYVFEAYQEVAPLAKTNVEAQAIQEHLESGWRPRPFRLRSYLKD